jgi:hypothetical protein
MSVAEDLTASSSMLDVRPLISQFSMSGEALPPPVLLPGVDLIVSARSAGHTLSQTPTLGDSLGASESLTGDDVIRKTAP